MLTHTFHNLGQIFMIKSLFIPFFLFIVHCSEAQNSIIKKDTAFTVAQKQFLNGLEQKNITALMAVVDDSLTTIFPDGEIMHSKEKYRSFNEAWFKKDWKITTEIVGTDEKSDLAYSVIKYKYIKFNPDKSEKPASHIYLLLIFKKRNNEWVLVHNQHTKIL